MVLNMKNFFIINLLSLIVHLTSSQYPIEMSVSQHKKYLPYEISTFIQHVNIDIKTGENPEKELKQAQDLFLILDTSSSMSGNKIANAKLSIENIIQHMNKDDKLHLIEYNSGSRIVFENENNRDFMLNKLESLNARASTNLMSGLDQVKILLERYSKRTNLRRIFIFSDGQINEGVTDHKQLLNEIKSIKNTYELTICSFGIGLDFDEELMTNIADYGGGDYFFIEGAESMRKVVKIAYEGFQQLMGTNAYLKLKTLNDANIVDTYGYENVEENENYIISIGDIRYNDQMNVLLQTQIQITKDLIENNQIDFIIIELWMTDIHDKQSKLILKKSVEILLTENKDELNYLDQYIENLIQIQNVQKREKEVTQLLKEQRRDEAFKTKENLHDEINQIADRIAVLKPTNQQEKDKLAYLTNQINTIKRRSQSLRDLFRTPGVSNSHLSMSSGFSSRMSSKYHVNHDDL